jgi:hypothetical protein
VRSVCRIVSAGMILGLGAAGLTGFEGRATFFFTGSQDDQVDR